jgi:hypothetical protein
MQWEQVLTEAAAGNDAAPHLPAIITLLTRAVAGRYEPEHVEAVFDSELWKVPYLTSLEQCLWAGSLQDQQLQEARAVLVVFPTLMDRFRAILAGSYIPPDEVKEALATLASRAGRTQHPVNDPGAPHCPRCGSYDIDTQHSNSSGARAYEAACDACGYYAAWREDEQPVHPWGSA